jgi:ribosomal RNA-processing protein 36
MTNVRLCLFVCRCGETQRELAFPLIRMSRRPQSARAPVEPDEELSFEQLFERRNQQQRQKAFAASNRDDSEQDDSEADEQPAPTSVKQPKKKNKDKPIEMSSKRPVPRLKSVFPQASKAFQPRDPRFDPMCGELDRRHFRASYGFIDELRQNEIGALRKELQKVKSDDKRVELQTVLGQYVRTFMTTETVRLI